MKSFLLRLNLFFSLFLFSVPSPVRADAVSADYVAGMEAASKGDTQTTRVCLERSLEKGDISNDATAYSVAALVTVYARFGDCEKADRLISAPPTKILEAGTDARLSYFLVASWARRQCGRKWKSSLKYARQAVAISPTAQAAKINLLNALLEEGKTLQVGTIERSDELEEALAISGQLTSTASDLSSRNRGEIENAIGRIFYVQKKFVDAEIYFKRAIHSDDQKIYRRNLGWVLYGGISIPKRCHDKYLDLVEAEQNFEVAGDVKDVDSVRKEIAQISAKCKKAK